MSIEDFILRIEEEFDDIIPGKLRPESNFCEILDWNSNTETAMNAMFDSEYEVRLSSKDFQKSKTFRDLFDILSLKADKK
jgi:acyl carrier protein